MAEDISNKTVIILLIIAIVVSALGTWSVLEYATTAKTAPAMEAPQQTPESMGKVSLEIVRPEGNNTGGE